MYQNINREVAELPAMVGHGVRMSKTDLTMWEGPLDPTGNPLDFALTQEGTFFATRNAAGEIEYTRAGNFILSIDDGGTYYLAAPNGDRILDNELEDIAVEEFEQVENPVIEYIDAHGQTHYEVQHYLVNGAVVNISATAGDNTHFYPNGKPIPEGTHLGADGLPIKGEPVYVKETADGAPIIPVASIGVFRFKGQ